jgi:hypothetical protein
MVNLDNYKLNEHLMMAIYNFCLNCYKLKNYYFLLFEFEYLLLVFTYPYVLAKLITGLSSLI